MTLTERRVDTLYELFHENTKIHPANESWLERRISALLGDPDTVVMLTKGYHRFPQLERVELPRDLPPVEGSLESAIRRRRSARDFADSPLTIDELSQILSLTYGVTGAFEVADDAVQLLRAAPSAGALYPIELYVIVQRVTDLQPGVYHYNVPDHALERMPDPPDLTTGIRTLGYYEQTLAGASVLVVLTAVFERTTFKYGDRGYRFALLDAGHVAQNLLLVAATTSLGAVPIGGFRDDQLSELVGADGVNEAAVYVIAVGRPATPVAASANRG